MPDLYDDDLDDNEEDAEQGGVQQPQADNPLKAVRAKLRREEKARKEAETELAELRQFKATYEATTRKQEIGKAFEGLGVRPEYADLYPSDAEATPEAVQAFALKYGWIEIQADEEEAQQQTAPTFAPVSVAGAVPAKGVITKQQLDELAKTNPAAAQQAINSGRVTDLKVPRTTPENQTFDW